MSPEQFEPKPFSMFEPARNSSSRLLIIGEAPGEEEEKQRRPFVGPSGKLLDSMLEQVGFSRGDFHITNVFSNRPPENDLKKHWTLTKTELKKLGYPNTGRLPTLNKRYIHPDHEPELERLAQEIDELDPEFILLLGGTALWALTAEGRITVNRGALVPVFRPIRPGMSVHQPLLNPDVKSTLDYQPPQLPSPTSVSAAKDHPFSPASPSQELALRGRQSSQASLLPEWAASRSARWALPSFHPAMILRQWDNRPLLWADLIKARRFLADQLPRPLSRRLWVDPTFSEIEEVYNRFLHSSADLGCDIETDPRIGQITMISFGTPEEIICIPFFNKNTLAHLCNYWKTAKEEAQAWRWVIKFSRLPNKKVLQNGLYDTQYLLEDFDIRLRRYDDDTAILQHCIQPELPKALGTLASVYLNEPSWKFMRESEKDANKADE